MVETGSAGFESDFRKKVEFQTPLGCIGQLENITLWCFPGIVRLFRDNGREISCRRRLRVIPGWISKRATIKLRNKIALSPEERAAWAWPTKHIVAEGVYVFISGRHPELDAAVREIGGKATRGLKTSILSAAVAEVSLTHPRCGRWIWIFRVRRPSKGFLCSKPRAAEPALWRSP
jgi:hypothetical protein